MQAHNAFGWNSVARESLTRLISNVGPGSFRVDSVRPSAPSTQERVPTKRKVSSAMALHLGTWSAGWGLDWLTAAYAVVSIAIGLTTALLRSGTRPRKVI